MAEGILAICGLLLLSLIAPVTLFVYGLLAGRKNRKEEPPHYGD
jgi:hypothetical protein